jgi:short-subunit dehydrogenase
MSKMKKSIFITGATTGIGHNIAELYLEEGHRVAITGRNLSKVSQAFKDRFENLELYEVDVTNAEAMDQAVESFSQKGLDIIIANAGISHGSKSKWPDMDVTRSILNTNVMGVVNTFAPALKFFEKQKKGHLVAVASVAGFVGLPGASAYSASKSAVIKLCESYALDLPDRGIDVTTICPGFIDTPLTQKNDHSMPFLMSAKKGARLIVNAIESKKVLFVFPWQMSVAIHILSHLPRFIYRFMMKLPVANYSKS